MSARPAPSSSTPTARCSTSIRSSRSATSSGRARARNCRSSGARSSSSTPGCAASWDATRTSRRSPRRACGTPARRSRSPTTTRSASRLMRAYLHLAPFPGSEGRARQAARLRARDPLERLAGDAAGPRRERRPVGRDPARAQRRRARDLQALAPGVPARRRPARRAGRGDRLRVVERLGRGGCESVRLSHLLGEPRRRTGRSARRRARPRDRLARRAARARPSRA